MKFDEDADLSDPAKFQEYLDQQVAADEAEYEARKANKNKTANKLKGRETTPRSKEFE